MDQPRLPSDVLRRAIQKRLDSHITLYRIAANANVSWQTLQRFVERKRSLSLASFDALCKSLGLKLSRDEGECRQI